MLAGTLAWLLGIVALQSLPARLVAADADNRKLTLAEELPLFEAIARRRGAG